MKRAEGHIFCLDLYEILTQPSNILAKPCRFKMLQRTNTTQKTQTFPVWVHRASIAALIWDSSATSDITA